VYLFYVHFDFFFCVSVFSFPLFLIQWESWAKKFVTPCFDSVFCVKSIPFNDNPFNDKNISVITEPVSYSLITQMNILISFQTSGPSILL
jgi:hypothetical protein